ncbi:MAG: ATP-binding protein [Solibacillus sp.]
MEFSVEVPPNEQAIQLVDAIMKSYVLTYHLPNPRELCFVLHELVINAVEAMEKAFKQEQMIQVQVMQECERLQMVVIDGAEGIPKERWSEALTYNIDEMADSDRGRGLFFVQHMVDQIWFQHVTPDRFLVGVTKNLST